MPYNPCTHFRLSISYCLNWDNGKLVGYRCITYSLVCVVVQMAVIIIILPSYYVHLKKRILSLALSGLPHTPLTTYYLCRYCGFSTSRLLHPLPLSGMVILSTSRPLHSLPLFGMVILSASRPLHSLPLFGMVILSTSRPLHSLPLFGMVILSASRPLHSLPLFGMVILSASRPLHSLPLFGMVILSTSRPLHSLPLFGILDQYN